MLVSVGMPSSVTRWRNTPSSRASARPTDPARSVRRRRRRSRSSTPGGREQLAGVPDARARGHPGDVGDGEQLRRRAVQAGARRADPDGDRARGQSATSASSSSISSSLTTAPRLLTWRINAWAPSAAASSMASSMASTTMWSNSPLTRSTSTGQARHRRHRGVVDASSSRRRLPSQRRQADALRTACRRPPPVGQQADR